MHLRKLCRMKDYKERVLDNFPTGKDFVIASSLWALGIIAGVIFAIPLAIIILTVVYVLSMIVPFIIAIKWDLPFKNKSYAGLEIMLLINAFISIVGLIIVFTLPSSGISVKVILSLISIFCLICLFTKK